MYTEWVSMAEIWTFDKLWKCVSELEYKRVPRLNFNSLITYTQLVIWFLTFLSFLIPSRRSLNHIYAVCMCVSKVYAVNQTPIQKVIYKMCHIMTNGQTLVGKKTDILWYVTTTITIQLPDLIALSTHELCMRQYAEICLLHANTNVVGELYK